MHYWLVKTEPETFSWDDLARETCTKWTGVRNYQARNFLREMKKNDLVFVYHSGTEKAIRGIAKVITCACVDETATEGDWSMVELVAVRAFKTPVTLAEIKQDVSLKTMTLVNNPRLSVQPVTKTQWQKCVSLSS